MPSPDSVKIERAPQLSWLVLFCLCVWLPGFLTLPPTDRDESRFAQATKQMMETHDFVRIMNGAEPRNRKPIGIYWAQLPFAAAARAAGVARRNPIWPYRLPSLLGALLAVLAMACGGVRLAGGARAAWIAGLWLAACLLVVVETHLAKTDGALLGVTTGAMLLLGRAFLEPERFGRWQAAGFWAAVAAGILLKGPVTPMVAGLCCIAASLAARRWAWLRALRPVWGLPLLLVLVLPWFVAIGLATHGAFFAQSVGGDLGSKLSGGDDAHGAPFGSYLLMLPVVAFPAALPVLRAVPGAWSARRQAEVTFLLAWLVPSWLVFELIPTKLPHYVLPLYPAVFLLAARLGGGVVSRWWGWVSAGVVLLAGAGLAAAAVAAPVMLRGAWWLGLPAGVAIAAVCVGIALGRRVWPAGLMPLATVALLGLELPHLPALWVSSRIAAEMGRDGMTGLPYAAAGYDEPSLMFLAGTQAVWLRTGRDLGDWLIAHPRGVALVEDQALAGFRRVDPGAARRGTVGGYDYSNGHWVRVGIYREVRGLRP